MKYNFLLFLCLSLCSSLAIGQIKSLSVFGEAKGLLAADYAVFTVTMDDQECSVRFPDLQAKQKRYVELTKEFKVPAADNALLEEKTTRMANYDGMKDVHMARYQLTLRDSDQFMQFMKMLDEEIPGSDLAITTVEFGDKNAERELVLTQAFTDAKHRAEVLAKQGNPANPPHIIVLPEIPLNQAAFLNRVKDVVAEHKYCVVVCGEGVKNEAGEEIGADKTRLDAFGHAVLSGAADALASIVQGKLNLKTRTVKLGYAQRAAAHYASLTDADEAFACGTAAVRAAVSGKSGLMPKIVRLSSTPYRWEIQLEPLENIANVEHFIPRDWISEDGFLPNEKFVEYAAPLIEGQVIVPQKNGLPSYTVLAKSPVEKKLAPRA
jgi:hypothetical protein